MDKQDFVFVLTWFLAVIFLICWIYDSSIIEKYKKQHEECIHWVRKLNTVDEKYDRMNRKMALSMCSDGSKEETFYNINLE